MKKPPDDQAWIVVAVLSTVTVIAFVLGVVFDSRALYIVALIGASLSALAWVRWRRIAVSR